MAKNEKNMLAHLKSHGQIILALTMFAGIAYNIREGNFRMSYI